MSLVTKGDCGRGGTGGIFSSCSLLLTTSLARGDKGDDWSLRGIRGGTCSILMGGGRGSLVTGGGRGGGFL